PKETYDGGIAEHYWQLSKELMRLGHNVTVISSSKIKNQKYKDDNINVYRVLEKNDYYYSFLEHSKNIDSLTHKNKFKFDVVEAPEWKAEAFFLTKKFPIVTRCHSPLFLINKYHPKNIWETDKIQETIEFMQAKESRKITTPSKSLAKDIQKEWGFNNIKIIPYGLEINPILDNISENKKFTICYVGRIEYRKGVLDLAIATKKLSKNVIIQFIGKDTIYNNKSLITEIKKINPNIKFINFLDTKETFKKIKNSNLIVIPSHWDNLPFVCLQSMFIGTPLLVSDAGGLPEMINHNKTGLVFSRGNVVDLTKKLQFAINNAEYIKKLAKKAKIAAKHRFNLKKNTLKTIKLYKEAIL
ncbi:MAG: glycosyltransferase family 4 protein, partial [Candidatus ainarchaeum sp.]|nr:glycosyltransferase family 4 protein [Candidatus ainarchaeum sp.]